VIFLLIRIRMIRIIPYSTSKVRFYSESKCGRPIGIGDPDPNGDDDPVDAAVVRRILLTATSGTAKDANITGNAGMGGQGILPIPVVYNG
jgi:hypothetical protein